MHVAMVNSSIGMKKEEAIFLERYAGVLVASLCIW